MAQTTGVGWDKQARDALKRIDARLARVHEKPVPVDELARFERRLAGIRQQAQACIDEVSVGIARMRANLATLGEPLPVTSTDVATKSLRKRLEQGIAEQEARRAVCRALLIDAGASRSRIQRLRKAMLAGYLLAPGPTAWEIVLGNLGNTDAWTETLRLVVERGRSILDLPPRRWLILGAAVVLGGLLGWILGQRFRPRSVDSVDKDDLSGRFMDSCRSCLGRPLPALMALLASAAALWVTQPKNGDSSPLLVVPAVVASYLFVMAVIRILLRPSPPAVYFLSLDASFARSLYRRLRMLALLGSAWILAQITGLATIVTPMQWFALRGVFLLLVAINLIWIFSGLGRLSGLVGHAGLRGLVILSLFVSIGAELLGYHNLAFFIVRGLASMSVAGLGFWLIGALIGDLLSGLESGQYPWQRRLRRLLGLQTGDRFPGLVWLRLGLGLLPWFGFALLLPEFWGYTARSWAWWREVLVSGFEIGSVHIVPMRLLTAIVVFAAAMAVVGWLRREALPRLVERTGLDRGAREATVTISGYIGVLLAAILALSLAGFDFTNIAIVAGALSVGIGFGLQNIVNNFVSGIILLFERPIRTNDWVIVGGTEGYVRRISIRSTLIETFDRADVIVPNSDLIAGQVTNMTLRDPWGRLVLPIGVAYGSDCERVRECLLAVAEAHPLVLKSHHRVSRPKVLFRGFGESSLDFELRCFVSDVDKRLDVLSDLNFAIDKAFREAGIEIPFPQRDLHLRTVPEGCGSNQKA